MAESVRNPSEMAQEAATPPVRLLQFPPGVHRELLRRSAAGYPHEVCGLIVGRVDAERIRVDRITQAKNLRSDRLADRYVLDPDDFRQADADAQRDGLEIVGIWHTHPDHPPRPSQTDLDAAWEGYSYVILSVARSGVVGVRSWILDGPDFVEQPIEEAAR